MTWSLESTIISCALNEGGKSDTFNPSVPVVGQSLGVLFDGCLSESGDLSVTLSVSSKDSQLSSSDSD
jgi:hypothetical protein